MYSCTYATCFHASKFMADFDINFTIFKTYSKWSQSHCNNYTHVVGLGRRSPLIKNLKPSKFYCTQKLSPSLCLYCQSHSSSHYINL